MMLNKAQFDWLTLTTFETKNADGVRALLMGNDWAPEKRLQYKGVSSGAFFVGYAMQNGKSHFMFQASGERCDDAYTTIIRNYGPYDWNITRCDLQVTIPIPRDYNSRELFDDLRPWNGDGKPRHVSIIQSGDGCDTIYVGHRSSDRFTRIYVKPLDGGLHALRFEVEYKGSHAHRVFNDCREPTRKRAILLHEIKSLPGAENGPLRGFLRVLRGDAHAPQIERVTGQNATLDWLRKQVGPTLARLCSDHDCGHEARKLLESWYNTYCSPDT